MREGTYILRMALSVICGAAIGFEREKRQKSAGIRTHIITALASCLMMLVSKYGFFDIVTHEGISVDASRIAAGVVTAIGFMGAGVIFVRRENATGLTTSAGIWATVGVGIAAGAGMYAACITATIMILIVQAALHIRRIRSLGHTSGEVHVNLTKHGMTVAEVKQKIKDAGAACGLVTIKKKEKSDVVVCVSIILNPRKDIPSVINNLAESDWVDEATFFTTA